MQATPKMRSQCCSDSLILSMLSGRARRRSLRRVGLGKRWRCGDGCGCDARRRMEVSTMVKTMVIEPVRAFSGMDVLVARDEGLFTAEGLEVQFASREPGDLRSAAEGTLANPVSTQGRLQARGVASMYQA